MNKQFFKKAQEKALEMMSNNKTVGKKGQMAGISTIIMLVVGLITLLLGIGIVASFTGNATFTANMDDTTKFVISFFGVFMALGGLVLIGGSLYAMTAGLFGRGRRRYR